VGGLTTQKIGTGEGAQAYGYGIYSAERRAVAEGYAKKLARLNDKIFVDNKEITDEFEAGKARAIKLIKDSGESLESYIKIKNVFFKYQKNRLGLTKRSNPSELARRKAYLAKEKRLARKFYNKEIRLEEGSGHLYKLSIPDADELLDWDKPLSEQTEAVIKHLYKLVADKGFDSDEVFVMTGEYFYGWLDEQEGSPQAASELLKEYGIKGIQYLDGGSRADGEGTHNYVVFADEDIEIAEMLFQPDEGGSADNGSMGEEEKQSFDTISGILATGTSEKIINKELGEITIDAGHTGKSGFGLKHIIEQRFLKDKTNEQDIAALLYLVKDAAQNGVITREKSRMLNGMEVGSYDISKNGIIAFVSKTREKTKEKFVITGFSDNGKKKEASDAIQAVIAQYGYTPEFSDVRKQVGAVIASLNPSPDDNQSLNNHNNGQGNVPLSPLSTTSPEKSSAQSRQLIFHADL
jgi:hypothetical protein